MIDSTKWLDIFFCVVFAWTLLKSLKEGLGSHILSLIRNVCLIALSLSFYVPFSEVIGGFVPPEWARALSFFLISIAVIALFKLARVAFRSKVVRKPDLTEKLIGAAFVALRSVMLFGLVGMQLLIVPVPELRDAVSGGSYFAMNFVEIDAGIYGVLSNKIGFLEKKEKEQVISDLFQAMPVMKEAVNETKTDL